MTESAREARLQGLATEWHNWDIACCTALDK